jgi:DNA modification methylase
MARARTIRRNSQRRTSKAIRSERRLEYSAPKDLIPNPQNARKHSPQQLSQVMGSIRQFGFTAPILTDMDRRIIAGHARHQAALTLGLRTVPIIRLAGLTDVQRRALAIADNKLALNADWDFEILKSELRFLEQTLDFNLSLTGFETIELDDLLAPDQQTAPSEQTDDDVPLPEATAVSRLGDRWVLEPHIVVCGDARDTNTFTALLGKERARMAFLDPPYNVKIHGHVSGLGKKRHREFAMGAGEMSPSTFIAFLTTTLENVARHCIDGAIGFVCIDWRHAADLSAASAAAGVEVKNLIVWCKTNAGMGSFYRSQHELIFALKVGAKPHVNNFGLGDNGRYRTNVWTYPGCNSFRRGRDAELDAHPTPKPVALVADAIRDVSHRSDIVLDCFGGSGATLIAAERTGRRARIIELDPIYVDVMIRRWEALTGHQAIHADTKRSFAQTRDERSEV